MEEQVLRVIFVLTVVVAALIPFAGIIGEKIDQLKARGASEPASPSDTAVPEVSSGAGRTRVGRMADKNGFEYACYRVRDDAGHERMGYCRIVPTTYAFTCPDCGGMVVGVDARRVWPGTTGPEPTSFRCEECGRQEAFDFGVPRVGEREGDLSFSEPQGLQPACPRGGKHAWEVVSTWSEEKLPDGVDPCLENLCLLEEVWYDMRRCTKCGEEHTERRA